MGTFPVILSVPGEKCSPLLPFFLLLLRGRVVQNFSEDLSHSIVVPDFQAWRAESLTLTDPKINCPFQRPSSRRQLSDRIENSFVSGC